MHAPVADESRQPPELDRAVGPQRDVVDDPDAVAEALRAAPLERLPDREQAEARPIEALEVRFHDHPLIWL